MPYKPHILQQVMGSSPSVASLQVSTQLVKPSFLKQALGRMRGFSLPLLRAVVWRRKGLAANQTCLSCFTTRHIVLERIPGDEQPSCYRNNRELAPCSDKNDPTISLPGSTYEPPRCPAAITLALATSYQQGTQTNAPLDPSSFCRENLRTLYAH